MAITLDWQKIRHMKSGISHIHKNEVVIVIFGNCKTSDGHFTFTLETIIKKINTPFVPKRL